MAHIDTVKPWFETGDFPTQAQFYQLFEWLRFRDQAIPMNEVSGLIDALNALALPLETYITVDAEHSYNIPAGYALEQVWLVPVTNCTPYITSVGSSEEGDIMPPDEANEVTVAQGAMWLLNLFTVAGKTITFKGLPIGSKIIIKKRKIIA